MSLDDAAESYEETRVVHHGARERLQVAHVHRWIRKGRGETRDG
jgi:hypothetical protein